MRHDDDGDLDVPPDALLLELMDLVTLAMPRPLFSFRVSFGRTEDGARPALTDLDGKARADAPARPPLGHDDNAVLDGINALLSDLSQAIAARGGQLPAAGAICGDDDEDGARAVRIVDTHGAAALQRRFDRSELRWLFWTAPLFRRLADTEAAEAAQATAVTQALRGTRRFDIDMEEGRIRFTGDGVPAVEAPFSLLGSWSDDNKRFLWGFGNGSVPARLVRPVHELRRRATGEGLRALTEPAFGCPEACADRLVRHAAAHLAMRGVYRAPFTSSAGKGFLYLGLLVDGA